MAIPTFDKLMLPLLQFAGDGEEHHIRDAADELAVRLQLSDEERNELFGKQLKFNYRLQWAKTYIKKAGLLDSTGRGWFQITQRGVDVLQSNPETITKKFLMRFPEFAEFATPKSKTEEEVPSQVDELETEQTPKELIHIIHQSLRSDLAEELIEYVLSASPSFFEQLVVDLLLAMGYGGSLEDAGEAIGRSGDGGLDGYIQEDKLGLDIIYIQAKRWAKDHSVGAPALREFAGSLLGQGAAKGVFITTSYFSRHAIEYAESMQDRKIVLIDGQQLTSLMIEHNVGVSVEKTYIIKKVDENYFPEIS